MIISTTHCNFHHNYNITIIFAYLSTLRKKYYVRKKRALRHPSPTTDIVINNPPDSIEIVIVMNLQKMLNNTLQMFAKIRPAL